MDTLYALYPVLKNNPWVLPIINSLLFICHLIRHPKKVKRRTSTTPRRKQVIPAFTTIDQPITVYTPWNDAWWQATIVSVDNACRLGNRRDDLMSELTRAKVGLEKTISQDPNIVTTKPLVTRLTQIKEALDALNQLSEPDKLS